MGRESTPEFFTVRNKTVTLNGWRSLTIINLFALGSLTAGTLLGLGLGLWLGGYWWFVCVGSAALLAYGLWATYDSIYVRINFSDGLISIDSTNLTASEYGPFYFITEASVEGMDDETGANALWLKSRNDDALFITFMSLHADTNAISQCLNKLLDESRSVER